MRSPWRHLSDFTLVFWMLLHCLMGMPNACAWFTCLMMGFDLFEFECYCCCSTLSYGCVIARMCCLAIYWPYLFGRMVSNPLSNYAPLWHTQLLYLNF
ncbi:hypothetical protein AMTRI_Chr11g152060 [Amborella trichopoda]